MARTIAVGMPENESERIAIAYLAKHLPEEYLLFHNLELPNQRGFSYEYDIIVIGEYAVYMVEIKGYRGSIRGNDREWELSAGTIYPNPLPLANKKSKIIKEKLARRGTLRNVFVDYLVVLTDLQVAVTLPDTQIQRVLTLDQAVAYMTSGQRIAHPPVSIASLRNQIEDVIGAQFRPLHRINEIGNYRVLDTIGRNNLYTTLLAEHKLLRTGDRFTLKMYNFNIYAEPDVQAKQKERILRDADALHRLTGHPNIAQASEPFPWEDNKYVLPVRWIDGLTLRSVLEQPAVIPFERRIAIAREVAEGLHFAHANGVIHRDIRPENIVVSRDGPVKLVNFDFARVVGSNIRTIAAEIGRSLDQRYVAPEVFADPANTSPASDQFSLGIVLYELLTGKLPYQRIEAFADAKGLPRPPSEDNAALPVEVDEIVARMCALRPTQRYSDFSEVIEYLAIIG